MSGLNKSPTKIHPATATPKSATTCKIAVSQLKEFPKLDRIMSSYELESYFRAFLMITFMVKATKKADKIQSSIPPTNPVHRKIQGIVVKPKPTAVQHKFITTDHAEDFLYLLNII
eukprot:TRINITY_DN6341_c0_g1_i4.p6 TRINITY_DN6341_c0_g1~~TRINITY_DN6341_c0_g1_i4.p6  ORF type:complete len:116 (+),score=5.33 TRINITY_DN6341_c0_g1_i4:1568-1915(+)